MSTECAVCLSAYAPDTEGFFLSSCGHALHHPCVASLVAARHGDGSTAVLCFEPGCGVPLLDSDVTLLSDPALVARMQRVRAARLDPSLRFCACGAELRGGSAARAELVCGACGAAQCWLHGPSRHAPGAEACAALSARERSDPAFAASMVALRAGAKQCPNPACGSWVHREGGCNSILCATCGKSFCWLCGQAIDTSELPLHYAWWNLRSSCRFAQFGVGMARSPAQQALLLGGTIVYGLLFGLPGALLAAALCLLFACCCFRNFARHESPLALFAGMAGVAASMLAMLTAVLLLLPVVLPFALLGVCLAACGWRWAPEEPGGGGAGGEASPAREAGAAAEAGAGAAAPGADPTSAAAGDVALMEAGLAGAHGAPGEEDPVVLPEGAEEPVPLAA
jgi:hypothetical protein